MYIHLESSLACLFSIKVWLYNVDTKQFNLKIVLNLSLISYVFRPTIGPIF